MDDQQRLRWARTLTTAGWLFVVAYFTFLVTQVRRAFALERPSFDDGLWGQRIEIVSFATIPQNVIILVPAAAAAVACAMLVPQPAQRAELWLSQLVRVVAGLAYLVIAVAVLGIIAVFWRDPDGVSDVGSILGRGGGIAAGIAMLRMCLEAERAGSRPVD